MSRRYAVGTGLPDTPTSGSEEIRAALFPLYRAINELAKQVSDATSLTTVPQEDVQGLAPLTEHDKFRTRTLIFAAGERVEFGRLLWFDNTATGSKVWHANALRSVDRPASGVCAEPAGINAGQYGRVWMFEGLVTGLSGLTPGTIYYLATNGQYSTAPPPSASHFHQQVALAIDPATLVVHIRQPN